jgi:hypothetical protein
MVTGPVMALRNGKKLLGHQFSEFMSKSFDTELQGGVAEVMNARCACSYGGVGEGGAWRSVVGRVVLPGLIDPKDEGTTCPT